MDATIDLFRCRVCRKLRRWSDIEKTFDGHCACGARQIDGGVPSNLFEHIQVWIWWLEVTIKLNLRRNNG